VTGLCWAGLNAEPVLEVGSESTCTRVAYLLAFLEDDLCGLTFELSGRRRQDARARLAKMYRVPPDRAWWPAVGAPLERGVRPHSVTARLPYAQARLIFFFEAAQSRR